MAAVWRPVCSGGVMCAIGLVVLGPAWAHRRPPPDALTLKLTPQLTLPEVAPAVPDAATGMVQPSPQVRQAARPPAPAWAFDASMDATRRHGSSQDGALTWAPAGGLEQSGWRLRLAGNRSTYSYPADPSRVLVVHGLSHQLDLLAGGSWLGERAAVTALLGRAWSRSREGAAPTLPQSSFKASTSLFAAPTPGTRVFSSVSYTRISAYTQFFTKAGWTLNSGTFWGPELKLDWRGRPPWEEAPQAWRLGAHVSGMSWLGGAWSVGAGRVQDHNQGAGAYLGLGMYSSY